MTMNSTFFLKYSIKYLYLLAALAETTTEENVTGMCVLPSFVSHPCLIMMSLFNHVSELFFLALLDERVVSPYYERDSEKMCACVSHVSVFFKFCLYIFGRRL